MLLGKCVFSTAFIALTLFFSHYCHADAVVIATPIITPQEFALTKLKNAKISNALTRLLEREYESRERDRIVELNILGFMGKADYSTHYSKRALKKCSEFIKKYHSVLKQVEKSTGVSKEVISALLWVETKHGKLTGHHYVSSVFFTLLQADHPEVIHATLGALQVLVPKGDPKLEEYQNKVRLRSVSKSEWALSELKALDQIFKRNPFLVKRLKGSFAGAFGYPQFIPSSYLQWARGGKKGTSPNLFKMEDAIRSVGFYLQANGWIKTDPVTHVDSLFHYNRAKGYGEVILKIADAIK